jgi:hypothetical protein
MSKPQTTDLALASVILDHVNRISELDPVIVDRLECRLREQLQSDPLNPGEIWDAAQLSDHLNGAHRTGLAIRDLAAVLVREER